MTKDQFDEYLFESRTQGMFEETLEHLLKLLTNRERELIKLRCGIGDGRVHTLEELGRMFGITRERVRQIEAKAIRKMHHHP